MAGGIHRKVLTAHTNLYASRAFMQSGYPSQRHEMLFDAHTRAFTAFGGVPKRGIYNNMKTAVDKVFKGNGRVAITRCSSQMDTDTLTRDNVIVSDRGVYERKESLQTISQSFKEEAVALITEQGYSVQQAADSLGIRSNTLYRWKQHQEQQSSNERLSEDERAELNHLRKKVKHLRLEKEIL